MLLCTSLYLWWLVNRNENRKWRRRNDDDMTMSAETRQQNVYTERLSDLYDDSLFLCVSWMLRKLEECLFHFYMLIVSQEDFICFVRPFYPASTTTKHIFGARIVRTDPFLLLSLCSEMTFIWSLCPVFAEIPRSYTLSCHLLWELMSRGHAFDKTLLSFWETSFVWCFLHWDDGPEKETLITTLSLPKAVLFLVIPEVVMLASIYVSSLTAFWVISWRTVLFPPSLFYLDFSRFFLTTETRVQDNFLFLTILLDFSSSFCTTYSSSSYSILMSHIMISFLAVVFVSIVLLDEDFLSLTWSWLNCRSSLQSQQKDILSKKATSSSSKDPAVLETVQKQVRKITPLCSLLMWQTFFFPS